MTDWKFSKRRIKGTQSLVKFELFLLFICGAQLVFVPASSPELEKSLFSGRVITLCRTVSQQTTNTPPLALFNITSLPTSTVTSRPLLGWLRDHFIGQGANAKMFQLNVILVMLCYEMPLEETRLHYFWCFCGQLVSEVLAVPRGDVVDCGLTHTVSGGQESSQSAPSSDFSVSGRGCCSSSANTEARS